MDASADRIVPLDALTDFGVADGDPDVRGWEVLSAEGIRVGAVDELLVDLSAMTVRYLDVDIRDGSASRTMGRHVLIPLGITRIETGEDRVVVQGLDRQGIYSLPPYFPDRMDSNVERSLLDHYLSRLDGAGSSQAADPIPSAGGLPGEEQPYTT